jgi:hypothetical protein
LIRGGAWARPQHSARVRPPFLMSPPQATFRPRPNRFRAWPCAPHLHHESPSPTVTQERSSQLSPGPGLSRVLAGPSSEVRNSGYVTVTKTPRRTSGQQSRRRRRDSGGLGRVVQAIHQSREQAAKRVPTIDAKKLDCDGGWRQPSPRRVVATLENRRHTVRRSASSTAARSPHDAPAVRAAATARSKPEYAVSTAVAAASTRSHASQRESTGALGPPVVTTNGTGTST